MDVRCLSFATGDRRCFFPGVESYDEPFSYLDAVGMTQAAGEEY